MALDRTLEPALPALLALLDVPVEDRRWGALDPPARRQRTIDALRRLLLRESQVQPLLAVFEDLRGLLGIGPALASRQPLGRSSQCLLALAAGALVLACWRIALAAVRPP